MRVKLSEKYPQERENICKRIIEILELDAADNSFLLCNLDEDAAKQEKILAMKYEINKYFRVSNISTFKPDFECKRPYLSIVRSILRQQNYTVDNSPFFVKYEGGLLRRTVKYVIRRVTEEEAKQTTS